MFGVCVCVGVLMCRFFGILVGVQVCVCLYVSVFSCLCLCQVKARRKSRPQDHYIKGLKHHSCKQSLLLLLWRWWWWWLFLLKKFFIQAHKITIKRNKFFSIHGPWRILIQKLIRAINYFAIFTMAIQRAGDQDGKQPGPGPGHGVCGNVSVLITRKKTITKHPLAPICSKISEILWLAMENIKFKIHP